jgi:primosomal protein N' (replication factor Y)
MARKKTSGPPQADLFSELEPPPQAAAVPAPISAPPRQAPTFKHLAEVAVEGPVRGLFTYIADGVWGQLVPGARVQVPFGNRTLTGFFIGERNAEELACDGIDPGRLKSILRVLDTEDQPAPAPHVAAAPANAHARHEALLTPTLLSLAKWMAGHYAAPLGSVLSAMLPAGVKRGSEGARVRMVEATASTDELLRHAKELTTKKPRQAALLLVLAATPGPLSAPSLLHEAEAPDSALRALEKSGLVRVSEEKPRSEGDDVAMTGADVANLALTDEQQAALSRIEEAIRQVAGPGETPGTPSVGQTFLSAAAGQAGMPVPPLLHGFLLQGVTGSGKTEVYLRALKTALSLGRQGIVLVPEIALTPQTAQRFEQRLGRERVAVLHSHVTDGERAEAWHAIREGRIDVVVGARSALFAPLPRLGVIVIDEEHENAFKQESTPRYHARDVAMELARLSSAVLVLGSATPSFESLYAARSGQMAHLVLSHRVAGRPMPLVEIVDMNHENQEVKRYSYLSRRLLQALSETLARGEQAILFMNRRGFATVITCLHCGHTEKCEHCDITLTSHRQSGVGVGAAEVLSCHYCGMTKRVPAVCAGCGSAGVKHWGMGTERVENEVRKTFPSARVARMDSDTMTRRTAYLEALGSFRSGKTDILVGTQMIAKGLDFPNVTLVGVVLADTALHMPDFRSRERTFQLLAQVSGRAGRSEKGGRVIIQTHLPQDPAIRAAITHDFDAFSLRELQERRAYGYPPFTRLARILIQSKDAAATRQAAQAAGDVLRAHCGTGFQPVNHGQDAHATITILGPAEAPIAKLEGRYRQHILLKATSSEALAALLSGPAGDAIAKLKGADATVDVDPLAML